jgi:hypothetical protein
MRKIFTVFLLVFFVLSNHSAQAEIIDVTNEEKVFGEWKVFCEVDDMMDTSYCKIASKFYQNTAAITIEPTAKFLSQLLIVIPQVKIGSFVQIRVDRDDIIISKNISAKDFGLIPLDDEQKNSLFRQMKSGNYLYLRFNLRDQENEVTARINLKDFRNALGYFNSKTSTSKK